MDLKDYRRQYTRGGLSRETMPDDPLVLFAQWQHDASEAGLADPTGCVVATLQPDGSLRQRFVLLKGVDADGFVFYTNYQSDKAAAPGLVSYEQGLPKSFTEVWSQWDLLHAKPVRVESETDTITGIARGISQQGCLRLETAMGEEHIMLGEVSLRADHDSTD